MPGDELKMQVIRHTGISVAHAKFLTESSAEIYVDQSAVGAIVGPGGENIRRLERQVGLKLDVKSVRDLPRNQRKRLGQELDSSFNEEDWRSRSGRDWSSDDRAGNRKGRRRKGRKGRR